MNHDSEFISNDYSEVVYAATKFGVAPSVIYRLKEELGTNNRKALYKALEVFVQPPTSNNIKTADIGESPIPEGENEDLPDTEV